MVKLFLYDKELENDDFEEIVYKFLYSKQITNGSYAISFPHENIKIEQIEKAIKLPYFETHYSLTPDSKLEYFYILLDNEQTKKIINKYYF